MAKSDRVSRKNLILHVRQHVSIGLLLAVESFSERQMGKDYLRLREREI